MRAKVPEWSGIADEVWVSVGSTNFDERSFRLNDEANLNIDDAVFAAEQVKITSTASTALKLLSVSSRKPKTQCKRRQR